MAENNTTGIDVSVPSVARMYDWLLGGIENYASDRQECEKLMQIAPGTKVLARNNREFLQRVVRVLAKDYGIRQFIDHGSGLPTQDNVHQIAQRIDSSSRVVYIDNDPSVLAHGHAALEENDSTVVIDADMRDTEAIFTHPEVRHLIDFTQPVAALFISVLHCLPDRDRPGELVRDVAQRLAPGSFLVVCQLVSADAGVRERVTSLMDGATHGHWGRVREEEEVRAFFEGMQVLEPGLVDVTDWRPDDSLPPRAHSDEWVEWGGVAQL
ncbi:SAM-dependent methyltransferase (plasmid) [Streptomyces sp. BB1-1-1]|uniref:SAM-dependent methyltransferase n=1 Tax=Streptomyces sp. BB1-1-1 TaxID=3074430 RepID=UPI00287767F0|nr:SAM-dependent methyltransferase [Streptomyces sp. BB1-1-1]WND32907.1 SAM-dependent methyltransferase [Streptomyces sp. BB1-1-1]WND40024.1 SAM-dependent methyltransferase [Streptomyces sp. BB1-1-1]WND40858.1 SAM-dependent methyltransferase [Streptomyces sp. BB1-1-1]